ncbi:MULTISPECIES: DUF3157 family protein [unclassified Sphingobacterium]|uniref:DUF3157 family protein n=1 Tax=unclassified Sphingobacterium TaxID=2609468 RepID=UPI0025E31321|nr:MULTISPECIES: DUF3157 family protein [unclassified Sphingobacterium]
MMRKLLFAILLSILTLSVVLNAQNKYATTTDGRTVLLKSDGTWEYVKDRSPSSNINQFKSTSPSPSSRRTNTSKSSSSTRSYIRGPRGGCYYINSNGNKTYVDRSMCN